MYLISTAWFIAQKNVCNLLSCNLLGYCIVFLLVPGERRAMSTIMGHTNAVSAAAGAGAVPTARR